MEEAEILARSASPNNAVNDAVTTAMARMSKEAEAREAKFLEQQQQMFEKLMKVVQRNEGNTLSTSTDLGDVSSHASSSTTSTVIQTISAESRPPPPPRMLQEEALASCRVKRQRNVQDDVTHFSSWTNMGDALSYARTELAPREEAEKASWRIRRIYEDVEEREEEHGKVQSTSDELVGGSDKKKRKKKYIEDKSRDKQWRCYRTLAVEVGRLMRCNMSYTTAVEHLQRRFESCGTKPHTPLLRGLNVEHSKLSNAEALARSILFAPCDVCDGNESNSTQHVS
jgi:hypothetical protein